MIIGNRRRAVHFRFNMIEVALALVILAIGLSSVMVLFPVGLNASRSSVAENNLGDVAERVGAYIQSRYTSSEVWKRDGSLAAVSDIPTFTTEDTSKTVADLTFTEDSGAMEGLFTSSSHPGYFLYRQYSAAATGDSEKDAKRAVDFDAIVRIGWDSATLGKQYYTDLATNAPAKFENYTRATSTESTLTGSPMVGKSGSEILGLCCRTLIIEVSWPADVPWANREKRIFRVEIFNENFVPYPQSSGSGS